MTGTRLRSIINSGTWMLILAPTYSMKIFIVQNHITIYVVPFVFGMLLAWDLIVGISIPSSILLPASLFTHSVMHHPATNSLVTLLARLIMMCITRGPRDTCPTIGVTNPNLDLCQLNKHQRRLLPRRRQPLRRHDEWHVCIFYYCFVRHLILSVRASIWFTATSDRYGYVTRFLLSQLHD